MTMDAGRLWLVSERTFVRIIKHHWLPQDRPWWLLGTSIYGTAPMRSPWWARVKGGKVSLRRFVHEARARWRDVMPRRSRCEWCGLSFGQWDPDLRCWVAAKTNTSRGYCNAPYCEGLAEAVQELAFDVERVIEATRAALLEKELAEMEKQWKEQEALETGRKTLSRVRWLLSHPEALQSLRLESTRETTSRA